LAGLSASGRRFRAARRDIFEIYQAMAFRLRGFSALFAKDDLPQIDVRAMPRVLRRIAALALQHRGRLALALVCTLGATTLNLIMPNLLGRAVSQAQTLLTAGPVHAAQAQAALLRIAALVIAASSGAGLLTMVYGYEAEFVSQRVAYRLRLQFFEQLQRLSFGWHDKIHSGDLITRGMLDIEGARNVIQMGLLNSITLAMLVGVATWRLLHIDLWIGLLALSFVPFTVWRASRLGYLLRLSWMRLQALMSILTRTMEESLQGMRVVRAFAAKDFEMARFDEAGRAALRLSNQRITLRVGSVRTVTLAFYISMALVLWVGGRRVVAGHMTIGTLTELVLYMRMLQMPIRQVTMVVNSAARATSSGTRLFEVLDAVPEVRDAPGAQPLTLTGGRLRFEDVSFTYGSAPDAKQQLSHVSFEVDPGKTLGIVGPPGAGKSTLAHLIPRFYDVTGGRITIDGQDVRDVTLASLREAVGVVQQDTFMFDATVTNNVAYADPDAEDERIVAATTTAQLHDYLQTLPRGYETKVGERGVALSGGQRQRMSIARGILPGPGVMVFDDSMAAIDAATEQRMRAALSHATRDKATLIIAHRLSSLMHADEIIVLEDGRIVERGDHRSLVAAGGQYAALYRLQTEKQGAVLDETLVPDLAEARI
jgi:ATP-binding cassette subfamily B multidrug efflux pump